MLTLRMRRNISLVLFIGLLLVSGVVWSMNTPPEGLKDGTFSGQATGFGGEIVVDVTISGGQITVIEIRPHQETPFIADPAIETLTQELLEAQSPDVDLVSGATFTSQAIIDSVRQALKKAEANFKDGVHAASVQGFGGPLAVEVTVSNGAIIQVTVLENSETPFIAGEALEEIPARIVAEQSWEVDALSGATVTSEAIMQAVEQALEP